MGSKFRLYSLRGSIYFYRWLTRFYDALLHTWHKDFAIALLAIIVLFSSVAVLGIAVWVFAGALALALHGDVLGGVVWLIVSAMLMLLSKVGVHVSESLLPLKAVVESENMDDVDV